jgi:LysM repeat protein
METMKTQKIIQIFLFLLLLAALLAPAAAVQAAPLAESANELITAVNNLRSSNGLELYEIDAGLMALAQEQSEYQASISTLTHNRADGSGPGAAGITAENIAYGPISRAMASWLDDQLHADTLLGFSSGYVGAGMATDANGYIYFTLVMRRKSDTTQESASPAPAATQDGNIPAPSTANGTPTVEPVLTLTPQDDGTIYHTLSRGQTLWDVAIAYGLTIVDLVTFNRLSPSDPIVYEGQELLVQPSYTPTITPTITNTPPPPTRTLRPTFTQRPPRAANTITPTYTTTPKPLLPDANFLSGEGRKTTAIILISICGIGLLVVVLTGIFKKDRP